MGVEKGKGVGKVDLINKKRRCVCIFFAVRTRLELATPCVTGMYSNQLNYRTNFMSYLLPFRKRVQRYCFFLI